MRRNRKLALLLVAIIFVALLLWLSVSRPGSPRTITLYGSQVIGRNIQFPYLSSPGSLSFFTGTSFARFDLTSYQTTAVTPEYALPNVTDVEWGNNTVLFETQALSIEDDLYKQASSDAQNGASSWWLCDLKTGALKQLLPHTNGYRVMRAVWSTDKRSLYALEQFREDASQQTLGRITPNTQAVLEQQPLHDSALVAATTKGALIQQGTALKIWNNKSLDVLPIKSNSTRRPFVDQNGNFLVYDDGQVSASATPSKGGALYAYDVTTGKQTPLVSAADATGNDAIYQAGFLILPSVDKNASQTNNQSSSSTLPRTAAMWQFDSGKKPIRYNLQLHPDDLRYTGTLRSLWSLDPTNAATRFAVVNTNNDLVLLADNATVRDQATKNYLAFMSNQQGLVNDAAYLFDPLANHLTIFVNDSEDDTPSGRTKILKELGGPGRDPNQVQKTWRLLNPSED